jgi:hypothetical protein
MTYIAPLAVVATLTSSSALAPFDEEPLEARVGDPGESCQRRDDCAEGLYCFEHVCRHRNEGRTCLRRSDCGEGLVCLDDRCVPRLSAMFERDDDRGKGEGTLRGHRFFGGVSVGPGISLIDGFEDLFTGMNIALRLGYLASRTEILLEVSPVTSWYVLQVAPEITISASIGRYFHLGSDFYWVVRLGGGLVPARIPSVQARLDPIALARKVGPVLLELTLPSIRANFTPGDDEHFGSLFFTFATSVFSDSI